jgi:hypothetical protein
MEARLMFVSAVAVVVTIAVCALAVFLVSYRPRAGSSVSSPRGVTESSVLKPSLGRLVYSDNFRDHTNDWSALSDQPGTSFSYTASGFEIIAAGDLIRVATSPYFTPLHQVSMSMTAMQSSDTPSTEGFGVQCRRGFGAAAVRYELLVTGATWNLWRRDGTTSANKGPFVIKQGTSPAAAGPEPMTVVGVCATFADGVSTRVAMFVNGTGVVDIVDTESALPGQGWLTGLLVSSSATAPSRVTVTEFEVRDLGG